jgi:hypothetical protein
MGLDMYLSAEKFVSGYEHNKDEHFKKILDAMNIDEADAGKSVVVSINVGYWRKANAIHNWFVQNVQNGEDNCARYYVPQEKLEELKADCEDSLRAYLEGDKVKAENIIAPTSGFFFGSTEIDQWYAKDLNQTIEIIDKCLTKFKDYGIYYQSSW